eukprot:gnl/TRDRNA2_/TRDRNA2_44569_c0_seq1.p1 gnl/TRDRNA2_/TRDRNA2_44569_c0~~gnl/TRDRNA2_/TRDRNA2_44569_c0_seq1.p1  ORF type:complete len:246 (+),score=48.30 gnl/TRDRNA2_/TRDRNA2_44569_c0_seq1:58-738(+)
MEDNPAAGPDDGDGLVPPHTGTNVVEAEKRNWRLLLQRRRAERGADPPSANASADSAAIPAKSTGAFVDLLHKQTKERLARPSARPIDPNTVLPSNKRQRTHARAPVAAVPRPTFPVISAARAAGRPEREQRRREITDSMREHTESAGVSVAAASSCGLDLAEMSAVLRGPRMSCDWQQDEDACSNSDDAGDGLEVSMPHESEGGARGFLRLELQRRISAAQVCRQ